MSRNASDDSRRQLRNRRFTVLGVIVALAIYVGSMVWVQQSNLALGGDLRQAITTLSITLIFAMLFVIGRNVVKLYVERRRQKIGSQFNTRVVVTYVAMALIPTVLLFIAAAALLSAHAAHAAETAAQSRPRSGSTRSPITDQRALANGVTVPAESTRTMAPASAAAP